MCLSRAGQSVNTEAITFCFLDYQCVDALNLNILLKKISKEDGPVRVNIHHTMMKCSVRCVRQ